MPDSIEKSIEEALGGKRLNEDAARTIRAWLSEEEYEEYKEELTKRITEGRFEELMDAFYRTVIFGTGGIRGMMDIGTNRINNCTIRRASQAYAQYLLSHKKEIAQKGVAIAFDSRKNSEAYMQETARVLAANGIPVRVFPYYRATPELSFAIRHLGLAGGIVVTASHNPPQFNGYKVYDERGVQVLPDVGLLIEEQFLSDTPVRKISFEEAKEKGLVAIIGPEIDAAFAASAKHSSVYEGRNVRIVFSPLHGVGSQSVLPVLQELGFSDVHTVENQMSLDGEFPNVPNHFPNPEFPVVYDEALRLAKEVSADIVLVSDPDADRLGIAVPDKTGAWHVLSGNQGAVLMGAFYLEARKNAGTLPASPVVIKTSVTTELVRDIAETYGAEVIGDLLVGFKFIGDRIENLPSDKQFLFACEESVGYLFSNAYRDKGAETPAIVAAEMAAWCKATGTTPIAFLESLYHTHGYYAERLYYRLIEGVGAMDRMTLAMKKLREQLPSHIGGRKILKTLDRLSGEVRDSEGTLLETRDWDKGDMLSFFLSLDERTAIHIRPSGTEPKMKYYTAVKGFLDTTDTEALEREAEALETATVEIFENIISGIAVDVFQKT